MKNTLKEVIAEITPSEQEKKQLKSKIDEFLKRLNKNLRDAKAILGGSGEKDTYLKGSHDADIFVKCKYAKYKDKSMELSNLLEKHIKKIFPTSIRLHGSRDYFQIKDNKFIFEVVPILDIKTAQQAKNITDVSPLHSKWVNKYPKLKDEIRLTKAFCKAQSVYGAESYIQGFSGYICEILTINYSSFAKLVKAAASWPEKIVIDVAKYYKNKDRVLFELNKAKLFSPIILIDPVQKDRNAAAALSKEKYDKFKESCKGFIRNPSKIFFEKKEITLEDLKKTAKKNRLIVLHVTPLEGKEDVVGSKLLKAFCFLKINLKENEFNILDAGWSWNKAKDCKFWYILDKKPLSGTEEKQGPPKYVGHEHIEIFRKKYKTAFLKKDRYYATVKREFCLPEKLVESLLKHPYLKDKFNKVTWILP
jgi:tRNA nucleotidyltransferase (CCA-adding enzyme)